MTNKFSHLNESGQAHMVDVSTKSDTSRLAIAQAKVLLNHDVLAKIKNQSIAKGDLLATARIAGIQAAKKCSDLIPLCHPLPLTKVTIDINEFTDADEAGLLIVASCSTTGKTGVEMEALTAASICALTIYDMCKALDKGIVIDAVQLLFAQLRDYAQTDALEMQIARCESDEAFYVRDLLESMKNELPEQLIDALSDYTAMVSVNHKYAGWDAQLHDGDEVGILPPVSGG